MSNKRYDILSCIDDDIDAGEARNSVADILDDIEVMFNDIESILDGASLDDVHDCINRAKDIASDGARELY